MVLNDQQNSAFEAFKDFLKSDNQVFILKGYAGTGKTTMISFFVDYLLKNKVMLKLMAPTGRAAKIIKQKTGFPASTIHRGIYSAVLSDNLDSKAVEETEFLFYYPLQASPANTVCIVDEASMISSKKTVGETFLFGSGCILTDLMTFARNNKMVFVGDPAQLPPVGDSKSLALDAQFFESHKYKVVECELTDVVRQGADSPILRNAFKVRDLLKQKTRNKLCFDSDDNQFVSLEKSSIVAKYCQEYPKPGFGNSAIICYSNSEAAELNAEIREIVMPGKSTPQPGEMLMAYKNAYCLQAWSGEDNASEHTDIMNGEFLKIVEVSQEVERRPVPVRLKSEDKTRSVELRFRDAVVMTESGLTVPVKILDNFVDSVEPQLDFVVQRALYIDFCIRYRGHKDDSLPELGSIPETSRHNRNGAMKSQTKEFYDALRADKYFNSLIVKYGYAITCHKSQGGEWDTAFVSFPPINFSDDRLRWYYTATTRAKNRLVAVNLPQVSQMSKLRMEPISCIKRRPLKCQAQQEILSLDDKLNDSRHRLAAIGAEIVDVKSMQYQERYTVRFNGSECQVATYYNGKMAFKPFAIVGAPNDNSAKVLECLNRVEQPDSGAVSQTKYTPSNEALSSLFDTMRNFCSKAGVQILDVEENLAQYQVVYVVKTDAEYAQIAFFVNAKGFVTYGKPQSNIGMVDSKLDRLVKLFQQDNV